MNGDDSQELVRAVGRMEGKLDALLTRLDRSDKANAKLEDRVTALEKNQWRSSGAAAGVGGLLGMLGPNLFKLLGGA